MIAAAADVALDPAFNGFDVMLVVAVLAVLRLYWVKSS